MANESTQSQFDRFLGWLLFEKRITLESTESPEFIRSRLVASLKCSKGMLASNQALGIRLRGQRQTAGSTLFKASLKAPRALNATLSRTATGTRLDGVLRVHGTLVVFAVIYPAIILAMQLYLLVRDPSLRNWIAAVPLMAFAFGFARAFCYFLLFLRQRSEKDFLAQLREILGSATAATQARSGVPLARGPDSREVFIRPRKS